MRRLYATFDARRVLVWQAHGDAIAEHALAHGRLGGPGWRRDRATRLRLSLPSLLHRNAWATRPGRERILAVSLSREGFDAILNQAVPADFDPAIYPSPMAWRLATRFANVTVSWHPEVDAAGRPQPRETVRVTVRDRALQRLGDAILLIEDWTEWVRARRGDPDPPFPPTELYPLSAAQARLLAGASGGSA